MSSTKLGHIALDGIDYVIVEATYTKQIQQPFNARFSTGSPTEGDLSFFQFLSMEDFSGGNGQEIMEITNRFFDSEGLDVTTPGELKLAPKIEFLASVNGPQHEHLNEPVEDEDGWPQIIEWQGRGVIYNDRIEHDAGGTDFLEVFETDVSKDKVISRDTSGSAGIITNDTKAEILDITKVSGLPGDVFKVTAKFQNIQLTIAHTFGAGSNSTLGVTNGPLTSDSEHKMRFRLYFGDPEPLGSVNENVEGRNYAEQILPFSNLLYTLVVQNNNIQQIKLTTPVTVEFTVRVPNVAPGVYSLWTAAGWANQALQPDPAFKNFEESTSETPGNADHVFSDREANAKVLFFVESVDSVIVERKNLYAPQLKAATVVGDKLVGGRVYDGKGYIEVYQFQNNAVDRTLQIDLTAVSSIPTPPTYMEIIGHNDVVVAAFDNKIYSIDILTSGLTDAQRITSIGTVPGSYVSGMALWNQRVYIGSFDKSTYTSTISWTNLTTIQGSYAIDGKFWITDMANFNGALFYSGGNQDGVGQVRAFPAEIILEFEHPEFDNRVRSLNAGRKLYAGWSHGTGLGVITDRGASTWARVDLGEEAANVVWGIEEVGDTVFILMNSGLFRTTSRYIQEGFIDTSQIGGNTPLIDKDWFSVKVELKDVLVGGQTIQVWASNATAPESFFFLGEIDATSSLESEFSFPTTFTSPWVKLHIELFTDNETTTPVIKRVAVKYVPASLQKLQWAFGVRATNNITMLDKNPERRTGVEIMGDLFDLRSKGRITFRDIDEQDYEVTVADMKQTNPIINKGNLEGLVTVELLEL